MSQRTIEVTTKLSDAELVTVCNKTNTRNPRKAVAHLIKQGVRQAIEMAALRAAYPRSLPRAHCAARRAEPS